MRIKAPRYTAVFLTLLMGAMAALGFIAHAYSGPPDTAAEWTFRVAGFDSRLLVDSVDAALSSTGDPHG